MAREIASGSLKLKHFRTVLPKCMKILHMLDTWNDKMKRDQQKVYN